MRCGTVGRHKNGCQTQRFVNIFRFRVGRAQNRDEMLRFNNL